LRSAAASIVSLDLQSTGLDDAAVAGFDAFAALTELRLSNNALTDAGVRSLGSLPKLEVLNLYGNEAVSDAALDTIAAMAGLRTVYLWNTGVTPDGVAGLHETRPDIEIRVGADFQ
jgi:hypothetical protein